MKIFFVVSMLVGTILFSQYWEDVVETFNQIPSFGIRSHAMGDAFIAFSGDGSAMFHNPAGISNIPFPEIQLGIGYNQFSTLATSWNNISSSSVESVNYLDNIAVTIPLLDSFVLGVGWSNPIRYLYNAEFTQNDADYLYKTNGAMREFVLSGGFRLNKNIQLGMGIHFIGGKNEYFSDEIINDEHFINQSDCEYSGMMANFGMIAKVTDFLDVGYAIVTPRWIAIDELWSSPDDTGSVSYEIKSSPQAKLGAYFHKRNFGLVAEVNIADSRQMTLDSGDLENDIIEIQALRDHVKQNMNLKLGGEFLIPFFDLKIRGGIQYLQSPCRDISENRLLYSCGFGILLDPKLEMNGTTSFVDWSQYQEDGVLEEYKFYRVALGMSFRL